MSASLYRVVLLLMHDQLVCATNDARMPSEPLFVLQLPVAVLTDPAALSEHVPVCKTLRERLELPLLCLMQEAVLCPGELSRHCRQPGHLRCKGGAPVLGTQPRPCLPLAHRAQLACHHGLSAHPRQEMHSRSL
uniref:Putative secreted protein n=1 Tax=Amblyomma triste TaxID=251400 RepID=A0A023G4P0_AMBTT